MFLKNLSILVLLALTPSQVFANQIKRVVSIGGANTEIIYALGAKNILVASDTTSYYPPEADKLPKVGYQRALSAEGILSLNPDLIILNDEAGPPQVLKQIEAVGVNVLKLKAARNVDDVKDNILKIGAVLEKEKEAQILISDIQSKHRKLEERIRNKHKKRVMFILQHSGGAPLVAGKNSAANSIIELSGAENAVQEYEGYKPLTPEAAISLKPEIILISSDGMGQASDKEQVLKISGIALTPAGKSGNIVKMDSLLMLGFTPRVIDAALELNSKFEKL